MEDPLLQISLAEAKMTDPKYDVGDIVQCPIDSKKFGRIATQNAKNVILQKIREEGRKALYVDKAIPILVIGLRSRVSVFVIVAAMISFTAVTGAGRTISALTGKLYIGRALSRAGRRFFVFAFWE